MAKINFIQIVNICLIQSSPCIGKDHLCFVKA